MTLLMNDFGEFVEPEPPAFPYGITTPEERSGPVGTRKCAWCGKTLDDSYHVRRLYCDDKCRSAMKRKRDKERK